MLSVHCLALAESRAAMGVSVSVLCWTAVGRGSLPFCPCDDIGPVAMAMCRVVQCDSARPVAMAMCTCDPCTGWFHWIAFHVALFLPLHLSLPPSLLHSLHLPPSGWW